MFRPSRTSAPARRLLPFERVALVLQGGGGLSACQAGVYEPPAESRLARASTTPLLGGQGWCCRRSARRAVHRDGSHEADAGLPHCRRPLLLSSDLGEGAPQNNPYISMGLFRPHLELSHWFH